MKKLLFFALGLTLVVASCNKSAFLKKLTGTWSVDRYLFSGQDRTLYFDTTFRGYQLDLDESNRYAISFSEFFFTPGTNILPDTLGYDSVAMSYVIEFDTIPFVDTTIVPHLELGTWDLINSDEDLQLRNDSTNAVAIYRILELNKSSLKLRKGNEEIYFGK